MTLLATADLEVLLLNPVAIVVVIPMIVKGLVYSASFAMELCHLRCDLI